jgi:hypothetical protein
LGQIKFYFDSISMDFCFLVVVACGAPFPTRTSCVLIISPLDDVGPILTRRGPVWDSGGFMLFPLTFHGSQVGLLPSLSPITGKTTDFELLRYFSAPPRPGREL